MNTTNYSYCRSRCRSQLKIGFFGLALSAFCAACFIAIVKYDVVFTDEFTTTVAKFALPFVFLLGVFLMLMGFRDALFPEKSTLAKSIRQQLKYPDESTSADELFAMVDKDIEKNGKWFGNLAIGKEWVFSDSVMKIDRIRAAFYKIEREIHNNRSSVTFILTLVDNKRNEKSFYMKSEDAMMTAYQMIGVLVPGVYNGNRKKFMKMSEADYNKFEAEFKEKQQIRADQQRDQAQNPQDMILESANNVTSRVNDGVLMQALQELKDDGAYFRLRPTRVLQNKLGQLLHIDCIKEADQYRLLSVFRVGNETPSAFKTLVSEQNALALLNQLARHKTIPDVSSWEQLDLKMMQADSPVEKMVVKLTIWGDDQHNTFDNFTREDVELAIQDVLEEDKRSMQIQCGWLYLFINNKDAGNSKVEMNASLLENNELKCFSVKCDGEQAKQWMLAFYDRLITIMDSEGGKTSESLYSIYPYYTLPDIKQWKDITKKFKK